MTGKIKKQGPHSGSIKGDEIKRRSVFKQILDTPFNQICWPEIDEVLGSNILELLINMLEPLSQYKKLEEEKIVPLPEEPEIVPFITLGFNLTNEALEKQAAAVLRLNKKWTGGKRDIRIWKETTGLQSADNPLSVIFVARNDIKPALLVTHFPVLCSSASFTNSNKNNNQPIDEERSKMAPRVKLICLNKGSMSKLSKASGIKNLGIIGLRRGFKGATPLNSLIDKASSVEIPWMGANISDVQFHAPRVKHLVTSAPIKASKNKQKKGEK
ncbi:hypothetical protein NADFUDRAFT_46196 [Nadsonia fulvescens var. elongata DSM 6958]|uniref:Uncharacterized protein n=1 Tax=Nadsonia fulvescens var. elongata DSM 6958 TaxID=857566 RepID=A0A1E3PNN4_9ASCO|nr:hypothetical protein NADFUDRAFT_46196 [Nadsonia fulvescens var. elongata DSM 6958]